MTLSQHFKTPLLNKLILNEFLTYFFILGLRIQNTIFQIDGLYTMPHFTMQINVFTKLILTMLVKFGKHSIRVNIYQWVQFFHMEEFSDGPDLYIFLYQMIFCQSLVHLLPVKKNSLKIWVTVRKVQTLLIYHQYPFLRLSANIHII